MALRNMEVSSDGSMSLRANGDVNTLVLTAGVAQTITIPANVSHAIFAGTADFWVAYRPKGAAAVPAVVPVSNIINGTSPELNPTQRLISDNQELSLVAETAAKVNIIFFKS